MKRSVVMLSLLVSLQVYGSNNVGGLVLDVHAKPGKRVSTPDICAALYDAMLADTDDAEPKKLQPTALQKEPVADLSTDQKSLLRLRKSRSTSDLAAYASDSKSRQASRRSLTTSPGAQPQDLKTVTQEEQQPVSPQEVAHEQIGDRALRENNGQWLEDLHGQALSNGEFVDAVTDGLRAAAALVGSAWRNWFDDDGNSWTGGFGN